MRPLAIKENGVRQLGDVELSLPIANALVQRVRSGEALYSKQGGIEIHITGEKGEKTLNIGTGTLTTRITRGNVVPAMGETLQIEGLWERVEKMVEEVEKQVYKVLRLRTNLPVMRGNRVLRDDNGKIIRRENVALLRIKMKLAQFLLECLDPEQYGRVRKQRRKQSEFLLSDFWRAKEEIGQKQG